MTVVPNSPCGQGIETPLMENQGVTSLKVSGTFTIDYEVFPIEHFMELGEGVGACVNSHRLLLGNVGC
jgi:hypothetical protein